MLINNLVLFLLILLRLITNIVIIGIYESYFLFDLSIILFPEKVSSRNSKITILHKYNISRFQCRLLGVSTY